MVDGNKRAELQIHSASQGQRTLPLAQALAGQVRRDERRRTGGVDSEGRTLQSQRVSDPTRGDAVGIAGANVRIDLICASTEQPLGVVGTADAHEHPGVGSGQSVRCDRGIFQGFPRGLQQQPMLRIEVRRFGRRETEMLWVELVDIANKPTAAGHDFAVCFRVGVVERRRVPSCGGHFTGRVSAGLEELPEFLRRCHFAGEPHAETDDGDGFAGIRT